MFGVPNFHSGLFFGAASLIAFNTLTQSPAIFLAFFFGVVSSGLLTAGLLCWMAINGYIAVCMGLFDALQVAFNNRDLASILLSIANIWNRRPPADDFPRDILRGLNVHPPRDCPLNGLRRAHGGQGPFGNIGLQGLDPRGPVKNMGAQGPRGPQEWSCEVEFPRGPAPDIQEPREDAPRKNDHVLENDDIRAPMGPDGSPQNPVGNKGPQGNPWAAMGAVGNMGTLFPVGNWGPQGDQGPQGHVPDVQAPREDVPRKNVRGPGDQDQ